jgi:isoleucyl-tRNA synthetase
MPDKDRQPKSVFLSRMPAPDPTMLNQELADKWDRLFRERGEVLKALEQARASGLIGHSLDAKVVLYTQNGTQDSQLLRMVNIDASKVSDVLIVSQARQSTEKEPFLDQLEVARESGQRGTYIIVDLPDGSRVIPFDSELLNSFVAVFKAEGEKCERCWKYDVAISKDSDKRVCPRCASVLSAGVSA